MLLALSRSEAGSLSFDAFVSYSHAADGRLAPALQRAMQRLAKPWYRARALRVFRDESVLTANPHLWTSIVTAMDDAQWFVLLASPDAVASEWVNRELDHWLSAKSADRILVAVTDGTIEWQHGLLTGSAIPAQLRDAFSEEPRHVDLRWAASETDLDMHNARFRDVVAQLAAPMHGIAKDELDSEDVRQYRRARRLARGGVTVLTLLVVIALITTGFAVVQRSHADTEKRRAQSEARISDARRLSAEAYRRAQSQPDLALLLAVEGHRRDDSVDTRGALFATLEQSPHLTAMRPWPDRDVSAVDFNSDGTRAVVGYGNGTFRLWDVSTMHPLSNAVPAATKRIDDAAFSRDGTRIATLSTDGLIARVWDARTRRPVTPPLRFESSTQTPHIQFAPDGGMLAATVGEGVRVWSLPSGRLLSVIPSANTFSVSLSPDGHTVAVASLKEVFLHDLRAGTTTRALPVKGLDLALAFNSDGSMIAAGGWDSITIFDVGTGRVATTLSAGLAGHGYIRSLVFARDGRRLVAGTADGQVLAFSLPGGAQLGTPLFGVASNGTLDRVALVAGDRRVVAGSTAAFVQWDFGANTLARSVPFANAVANLDVPIAAAGNVAVTGMGQARLWNVAHEAFDGPELPLGCGVACAQVAVAVTPDGRTMAIANGAVSLWSVATRRKIADLILPKPSQGFQRAAFSADGSLLAVASVTVPATAQSRPTGDVMVFDTRTHKRVLDRTDYVGQDPQAVAISDDDRVVAAGGDDGRLRLFNLATGASVVSAPLDGTPIVRDVAFTPDGIATVDSSGLVTFWDSSARPTGRVLVAGVGALAHASLSPDGKTLAAVSMRGALVLWDLATGRQVGPALWASPEEATSEFTANLPGVAFAAGGRTAIVAIAGTELSSSIGAQAASITFWNLEPSEWERRACQLAGRNLTRSEWSQFVGPSVPYRRTCAQWSAGT
jgi:WD40 repeat protein